MRYFGGKFRIRWNIINFLNSLKPKVYLEPFCGSCWIAEYIEAEKRVCNDIYPDLIALWKQVQLGWIPPITMTKEEWLQLRDNTPSPNALKGFAGFAVSDSGKFFSGYAKPGPKSAPNRDYARNGSNQLVKRIQNMKDVHFTNYDYEKIMKISADLIYCDPPYINTTPYPLQPRFDSARFWEVIRKVSKQGKQVYVSEYVAPNDFEVIKEIQTRTDMNGYGDKRVEKLFRYKA